MSENNDQLFKKLFLVLFNVVALVVLPIAGLYYFELIGLLAGGVLGGLLYVTFSKD